MYKFKLVILIVVIYSCRNKCGNEALKRFNDIEQSMKESGKNFNEKNGDILNAFEEDYSKRGTKVAPYRLKALKADSITKEFIKYVDTLIEQVVKGAGGRTENGGLKRNGDMEHHANLFINENRGVELKKQINKTREKLMELLDDEDKRLIQSDLWAYDNPKSDQTWESRLFEFSPAIAVVTLLEKIKNDAKNTEAQVLERLALAIDKKDCFFRLEDPAYRDSVRVLVRYYDSVQGTK